jgi:hypothetical protein
MNQYNTENEAGGYGFSGTGGGGFTNRVKVSSNASDMTNSAGDHSHSGTTAGMNRSHYHDFSTQTGGAHGHTLNINNNGTAGAYMDFRVQYIDVIICSKN